MTKTIRIGAAGIAMFAALGVSSAASAQTTVDADARAEILNPLTLAVAGELNYGRIISEGAGTVQLYDAVAGNQCSGDIICLDDGTIPTFTVSGTDGKDVTVTVASTATISIGGGTGLDEMDLTAVAPSSGSVTLTGGAATFTVGGTLTVKDGQNAGEYEGDISVQVDYS